MKLRGLMFIEKNEEHYLKCFILYEMLKKATLSRNEMYFNSGKEDVINELYRNNRKEEIIDFAKNLTIEQLIEEMISNENSIKNEFFSSYTDNMLFPYVVEKLYKENALETISQYSKILYLSEKSIDFLLKKNYFNDIKNFKNMFNQRITNKKTNSCHHLEENFKREYFKKILPKFESFFKTLSDLEKKECFDYLKYNIYTKQNRLLKVYFSDLKVSTDDIESAIKFLFDHEEGKYKKNIAEKYTIYLNNATNEKILECLKDYDITNINPHIISYLFERDITKHFPKKDIQSIVVKLSSNEKIKVLNKTTSQIKKEEWINYVFNENYHAYVNFTDLAKKEKEVFKNPVFLENNLNELKEFVTKNIFNCLFKENISGEDKKRINEKEAFTYCLTVLKKNNVIKYQPEDIDYFLNNFLHFEKIYSNSPTGLERIENHFKNFCDNVEKYLDLPKELIKLSKCSNIQYIIKSCESEVASFSRPHLKSFCEKRLIKESMEVENVVLKRLIKESTEGENIVLDNNKRKRI